MEKKKCKICSGELIPVNDFFKKDGEQDYERMKEDFKLKTNLDWKVSPNFNCIDCGEIHDFKLNPTGRKIAWLDEIKRWKNN